MTVAIGIDVGGTAIKGGVVSASGEVLTKEAIATQTQHGVGRVIERICGLIESLAGANAAAASQEVAVGLGVPGNIDHQQGVLLASPNLDGWRDIHVARLVCEKTGRRAVLENDANNAALGESVCGVGRGADSLVLLTLGTGIGSGVILGGALLRGATGDAGELGHTIVHAGGRRCACGQSGCLEAYASASSTVRRATEWIAGGEPSSLKEALDRGQTVTAEMVVAASEAGDALARRVWEQTCEYLAVACINIQHTLNPQYIVLAGGMTAAGERLRAPVQQAIEAMISEQFGRAPQVRMSQLGNDAGFIGAALSAMPGD